jgi:hypothetical protein
LAECFAYNEKVNSSNLLLPKPRLFWSAQLLVLCVTELRTNHVITTMSYNMVFKMTGSTELINKSHQTFLVNYHYPRAGSDYFNPRNVRVEVRGFVEHLSVAPVNLRF